MRRDKNDLTFLYLFSILLFCLVGYTIIEGFKEANSRKIEQQEILNNCKPDPLAADNFLINEKKWFCNDGKILIKSKEFWRNW